MKIDETRGRLEFEEQKVKNNMKSEKVKQERVHEYLHKTVAKLHVGTDTTNSKGMALNRRIEELERMIGVRACIDEQTGKALV